MKRLFLIIIIKIIFLANIFANGLTISDISYDLVAGNVSYKIQWNNSWYFNTGEPSNYDAVWTFVKFRDCSAPTSDQFTHGTISTNVADHNLSPGGTTRLQFVNATGTFNAIDAAPNNTGAMLKRKNTGYFANPIADTITLKITNLPVAGTLDLRIFAIEMVFIPSGNFFLGDGNTTNNQFRTSAADNTPILISSENIVSVYNSVAQINIPASFPKGYDAFFIMKYEITQQQYADFLNSISDAYYPTRFLGNFNSNRNRLNNTGTYPYIHFSDRPYRAQNFISWADITAYLDWAALAPMSEIQYEKACRGTMGYFPGEYAWGNTYRIAGNNFNNTEDGTEILNTGNCIFNNITFTGGDASNGPVRVGIFATPSVTNREQSGATYYGVMEMTGNVFEWCVIATETSTFEKSWGNGTIAGTHNEPLWPSGTDPLDKNTIVRGGAWHLTTDYTSVSDRRFATLTTAVWTTPGTASSVSAAVYTGANVYNPNGRALGLGGRGVR
ncbi:MAG: hypothetical protein A2X12_00180 [Bacteroidetes bacterium GWE2_29_8]|nr:MAG: hypothetical protein A2X12_00180 [Bacteroidetes bacterium GWE2_29_8]OFY15380.1 MAG: hypothetical protein A2X02_03010 [Bacteroidetes bacterium GWF2_29_10]